MTVMKTSLLLFAVRIKVGLGALRQNLLRSFNVLFGDGDETGAQGTINHAIGLTDALLPGMRRYPLYLQAIGNDTGRQKTRRLGDDFPADFLCAAAAGIFSVLVER